MVDLDQLMMLGKVKVPNSIDLDSFHLSRGRSRTSLDLYRFKFDIHLKNSSRIINYTDGIFFP
jgi:hypothetical protein